MIGVFDSGLGGLTALKEIHALFPRRKLIYFGDTGRVPYGSKSRDTIIKYAKQDVNFLLERGVDAIVVACGTVSTTALDTLIPYVKVPIIGVVDGAAEAAVKACRNGRIAVIGTDATIGSGAFERKIRELMPEAEVTSKACPLLVPLVENGFTARDDSVTKEVVKRYLAPIKKSGADTLILGCTHYPIISDIISDTLPGVTLISSGKEAAAKLASEGIISCDDSSDEAEIEYYVSDDPEPFVALGSLFLGRDIKGRVQKIDIESY